MLINRTASWVLICPDSDLLLPFPDVLEGKIPNNMELFSSPGFCLSPSNEDTNNKRVYVIKFALKTCAILSAV
jgi:hypothetical protein